MKENYSEELVFLYLWHSSFRKLWRNNLFTLKKTCTKKCFNAKLLGWILKGKMSLEVTLLDQPYHYFMSRKWNGVSVCPIWTNLFILEAAISSNYNGYDDMLTHSFLVYQFVHKVLTYPSSTVLKQAQPSLLSSQI